MCVSMPGTVLTVEGPGALIETAGAGRWCNAMLYPGLEPGDRVLVHAGLVIELLSPERALEIEQAFAEFAELAETEPPG